MACSYLNMLENSRVQIKLTFILLYSIYLAQAFSAPTNLSLIAEKYTLKLTCKEPEVEFVKREQGLEFYDHDCDMKRYYYDKPTKTCQQCSATCPDTQNNDGSTAILVKECMSLCPVYLMEKYGPQLTLNHGKENIPSTTDASNTMQLVPLHKATDHDEINACAIVLGVENGALVLAGFICALLKKNDLRRLIKRLMHHQPHSPSASSDEEEASNGLVGEEASNGLVDQHASENYAATYCAAGTQTEAIPEVCSCSTQTNLQSQDSIRPDVPLSKEEAGEIYPDSHMDDQIECRTNREKNTMQKQPNTSVQVGNSNNGTRGNPLPENYRPNIRDISTARHGFTGNDPARCPNYTATTNATYIDPHDAMQHTDNRTGDDPKRHQGPTFEIDNLQLQQAQNMSLT